MKLRDFVKTNIYKIADCVEYIGADGMEVSSSYSEDELMDCKVICHHITGGYLEIQLDIARN